jgi:hypothetical protein
VVHNTFLDNIRYIEHIIDRHIALIARVYYRQLLQRIYRHTILGIYLATEVAIAIFDKECAFDPLSPDCLIDSLGLARRRRVQDNHFGLRQTQALELEIQHLTQTKPLIVFAQNRKVDMVELRHIDSEYRLNAYYHAVLIESENIGQRIVIFGLISRNGYYKIKFH